MTAPQTGEFTLSAEEEAALGDPGKAAIDRMKASQQAANARAAKAEADLAAALKAAQPTAPKPEPTAAPKAEDPVDVASLVKAEADKIRADALREKAADKLEAKAAKVLADPADASRYLKIDDFVVDGNVDVSAMEAALAELVKSKPYLKSDGGKPIFEGTADNGPKGSSGKEQISRAEVDRLASTGVKGMLKIEEYRLAGQLDNLMGVKN